MSVIKLRLCFVKWWIFTTLINIFLKLHRSEIKLLKFSAPVEQSLFYLYWGLHFKQRVLKYLNENKLLVWLSLRLAIQMKSHNQTEWVHDSLHNVIYINIFCYMLLTIILTCQLLCFSCLVIEAPSSLSSYVKLFSIYTSLIVYGNCKDHTYI